MIPTASKAITFRFRRGAEAGVGVVRMPSGVTSSAQARISAIGNPIRSSTMTSRKAQAGSSHAGKTAEASWIIPPAITT